MEELYHQLSHFHSKRIYRSLAPSFVCLGICPTTPLPSVPVSNTPLPTSVNSASQPSLTMPSQAPLVTSAQPWKVWQPILVAIPAALARLCTIAKATSSSVQRRSGALAVILASHGVFPVKLIRLRRPLAGHPRSGAKRSGAGSEATLTRQRPDTLSRASAPLRALGCLCGLCRAHSFWHCASPWRLDPKREPVFRMQP